MLLTLLANFYLTPCQSVGSTDPRCSTYLYIDGGLFMAVSARKKVTREEECAVRIDVRIHAMHLGTVAFRRQHPFIQA